MTKYISFDEKENFKPGYVTLYDRGGNKYVVQALKVPGYGWVPCSRRLNGDFTTQSDRLILVLSEPDDEYIPSTSPVWITLDKGESFEL